MKSFGLLFFLSLVMVLGACSVVDAGYVFMKNGYIIQGRVVEQDDDHVVLRWSTGSMTIYQRFIDDVVLNAMEIEDFREAARIEEERKDQDDFQNLVGENDPELELPDELGSLIPLHDGSFLDNTAMNPVVEVNGKAFSESGDSQSLAPGEGTLESPTEIPDLVVERPPVTEEKSFLWGGFALVPPSGWELQETDSSLVLRCAENSRSGMTVHVRTVLGVDMVDARKELRAVLTEAYSGAQAMKTTQGSVDSENAWTVSGQMSGGALFFSLTLVEHEGRGYLISTTREKGISATDHATLTNGLAFRFLD